MSLEQMLLGEMSPWLSESDLDVPRKLPLKFHQNLVSNSWDFWWGVLVVLLVVLVTGVKQSQLLVWLDLDWSLTKFCWSFEWPLVKYCSNLEQHLVNCSAPGWSTTVCKGLRYLLNCSAPPWSTTVNKVLLQLWAVLAPPPVEVPPLFGKIAATLHLLWYIVLSLSLNLELSLPF